MPRRYPVEFRRKVLDLILRLKASGTGIVIVSHNLRHVFSVADRILVMRKGRISAELHRGQFAMETLFTQAAGVHPAAAARGEIGHSIIPKRVGHASLRLAALTSDFDVTRLA